MNVVLLIMICESAEILDSFMYMRAMHVRYYIIIYWCKPNVCTCFLFVLGWVGWGVGVGVCENRGGGRGMEWAFLFVTF